MDGPVRRHLRWRLRAALAVAAGLEDGGGTARRHPTQRRVQWRQYHRRCRSGQDGGAQGSPRHVLPVLGRRLRLHRRLQGQRRRLRRAAGGSRAAYPLHALLGVTMPGGINYIEAVYEPALDVFAREITVSPVVSQPGVLPFAARGIYDTKAVDVTGLDGSVFSDTQTILDILESEFPILPVQGDRVTVPASSAGMPACGEFEVIDADSNGGGETTLALRKYTPPVTDYEDRED